MRLSLLMVMLGSLASGQVLAEACDVVTRSSSEAVKPVEGHTCYSFGNMPAEAINWSCSNESKDMLSTEKHKVARCADGSVGSCIAPLTQEGLANPKATGRDEPSTRPALAKDARVITYYYDTPSLGQARNDCERNNGIWQTH
ncbi:hypothetical protein ACU5P1_12355 [Pseudomonas plecoglossicida]|uniref:Lipoprotein n=1 Tax=Pseudomonas plecoglossicida TaxID=70775 RepID=A0AAD0QSJ4_PSEDL|nr:hypothetical protein [Pseudomonas plecoglossicida]AXM94808.1 hypothetical protein DVB73_02710 [Pseudomonas plecoglossicida]EPB97318.1 hypothetical protein L321_03576 [Pseudomonas plecoglossicida NB2011]QLB55550.1 hypothetical protein HAV28_12245 [Pseudomonas plecoglossicida]GLR38665.1 hypothetical protein GCM10011247_40640 [Pseudomonas plecoglossicida]